GWSPSRVEARVVWSCTARAEAAPIATITENAASQDGSRITGAVCDPSDDRPPYLRLKLVKRRKRRLAKLLNRAGGCSASPGPSPGTPARPPPILGAASTSSSS